MSSPPKGPTPEDSARAQALSQVAGQMFNTATVPQQTYAEALDQIAFNPIFQQVQSATNANSAIQNARANQLTNAAVNPYSYAGSQAFNRTANERLARVMGQPFDPAAEQQRAIANNYGAFNYPTNAQLPDFNTISQQAKKIAQSFPTIGMSQSGAWLNYPNSYNPNPVS